MFSKTVCLYLVTLCVFAAPPVDKVPLEKQQPTVIPIISQSEELESNGTYKFSYETANGITREETSYDKILPKSKSASSKEGKEDDSDESNEIHVQIGSYSYTAPDGSVISVRYIADENGFRPIGDHFPKSPSIAAARSAGKKGRKADLDKEESKSALAQANNGPKPLPSQPPQEAALDSDLSSESIEPKFGEPNAPSSTSSESPSEPAGLKSSTTEGSGSTSEASTTEASSSTTETSSTTTEASSSTTEASSSETSTPVELSSGISTSEPSSEASDAPTTEVSTTESSEASTPEGSTTEALTSESSTSDASTPESSTTEVSSTPESSTTEITSTAADQITTESSTTILAESSSDVTSDSSTTLASSETTTVAST